VYQAIHFDYRNYTCHLRDDQEGWVSFPYKPTYYRQDPEGEYWTLDGKRVSPTQDVDKEDISVYEKDVDINLRILLDLYKDEDEPASYQNKLFFDIEAEMGGAINLEYCQSAPSRITAVAMYDFNLKEYSAFILDDTATMKESLKDNVRVIPCHTETGLLMKVIDKWKEIDPTIITGWNIDNFDVPYMYNRMKKLLGERKANELSPIGIVKFDDFDTKMPYKIAGVNSLDYMRLYKKFIPKQQPSYGLDFIGKKEVGRGKIQYEGSLDKLFREDIDKFIEYNINDVSIIVDLDEKRKFIDLAVMVAHLGHVPYHYVYQTSRVVEGAIMTYLKRKDIVSPNKPTTMNPELKLKMKEDSDEDDEKFPGAYVKDPIPGLYSWNVDCDLESLYPSIIRTLNIGTESYIGRILTQENTEIDWGLFDLKKKDPDTRISLEDPSGRIKEIKIKDLIRTIEKNDILISPNGAMFSQDSMSIICEVVTDWFFKRKEYKQTMIKYGKAGDKAKELFYDLYQQVMKVFLNSIYGALGLPSFRYTDSKDILAIAVTLTGRSVNMSSMDYVNDHYNTEMDTDLDLIIMGDTDSIFVSVVDILKFRFPDLNFSDDEEVMKKIRELSVEFPSKINKFYDWYAINYLNQKGSHYFKTKSEVIAKRLYVSAKKQYAQFIVEKEGVVKEEFDFKGLDFMKSSFPPLFRDFTQNLVKDILFDKKKDYIDKKILEFRDKFKTLPLMETAKPTGVNKIREYIKRRPKNGMIFTVVESGTPVNSKAAIYHNDLLKNMGLDKKYPVIQTGDKIKWIYLKDSPYKIPVLAVNGFEPVPEILEVMEKYMDREMMFTSMLVKKLQKIYDNLDWGEINFNKNTKKFFKFK